MLDGGRGGQKEREIERERERERESSLVDRHYRGNQKVHLVIYKVAIDICQSISPSRSHLDLLNPLAQQEFEPTTCSILVRHDPPKPCILT